MAKNYYEIVTGCFLGNGWRKRRRNEDELRKKVIDISDFAKQKIRATSIEKDKPPVVSTTGEKHAVLGVQQLDHVFAIRNQDKRKDMQNR